MIRLQAVVRCPGGVSCRHRNSESLSRKEAPEIPMRCVRDGSLFETIAKDRGVSLGFGGWPALRTAVFGLAYQLSAVKIVDFLHYLSAVYAPDLLNFASK